MSRVNEASSHISQALCLVLAVALDRSPDPLYTVDATALGLAHSGAGDAVGQARACTRYSYSVLYRKTIESMSVVLTLTVSNRKTVLMR